ncbi:PEGA domain-containing protein [Corallococcus sp. CA047B]|nr:PEGA domain-containing protein [Corallococcus sp. CA047B]
MSVKRGVWLRMRPSLPGAKGLAWGEDDEVRGAVSNWRGRVVMVGVRAGMRHRLRVASDIPGSGRTPSAPQFLSMPVTSQVAPHTRAVTHACTRPAAVRPPGDIRDSHGEDDLGRWVRKTPPRFALCGRRQRPRRGGRCLDGGPRARAPIPDMAPRTSRLFIAVLMAATCSCARLPSHPVMADLPLLRMEVVLPPRPVTRAVLVERVRATGLRFDVMPEGARVFVDGRAVGFARQLESLVTLAPGVHQVSVRAAGHATWRAEVMVGDRPEPIQVTLTASP